MSEPARQGGRSFEELWRALDDVPEGLVGEIVAGQVQLMPRPNPPHGRVQSRLGTLIDGALGIGLEGPGGWEIRIEPRVRFGDEVRVPDLAGWRRERYVEPAEGPYEIVPDWACEVLSASTAGTDRSEKLPIYARAGVGHAWLLDPTPRTLEVLRRHGELWLVVAVFAGDVRVRAEPFETAELDLAILWRLPSAPTT